MPVANPEVKLRRGGDQHSMMVKLVAAGAHNEIWVSCDVACHAVSPSIRRSVLASLIKKEWVQEVGGQVRVTVEGLMALERV